jgi:hypothetical protein
MTPYSACHPTQASQKRAPSASVSLTRHSSKVSQRIRAVPQIVSDNARLQERKALLPAGRIIQSPFDVLSRNWTSLDRNLPNSELLSLHRS